MLGNYFFLHFLRIFRNNSFGQALDSYDACFTRASWESAEHFSFIINGNKVKKDDETKTIKIILSKV